MRDEQADATRTRILDGLVRTMANGVAGLSIPAVAREAGVSVPTIYRHFGSKQGLVDALNPYVVGKARLMPDVVPDTFEALESTLRELFSNLEDMDATLRVAMASELGQQIRVATMPKRLAQHREMVSRLAPDVADDDLDRLARLSLILTSTSSFRAFKDYLGLSPRASADLVAWALRALTSGAPRRNRPR